MDKKLELWAAIAQMSVNQDGMLDGETWSVEHKKLLNECLNGVGCELSDVREEVRRYLMTIGFSGQQAADLRERVVRQMLGRLPEVPNTNGRMTAR